MAATAVTLNDLEGHSPVACLFKCNPSNISAAFCAISTDGVLARFLCISRASCSCCVSIRKLISDAFCKRLPHCTIDRCWRWRLTVSQHAVQWQWLCPLIKVIVSYSLLLNAIVLDAVPLNTQYLAHSSESRCSSTKESGHYWYLTSINCTYDNQQSAIVEWCDRPSQLILSTKPL